MNPIPTNHSTPLNDADLSLAPFITRQCGPMGNEAYEVPLAFYLSDLSSDANPDFDVNTRVVPLPSPQAPQGTHPRNVKHVRHPLQCHIWPGTIPQVTTPQATTSYPQFSTPPPAAPQPTFGAFDGAHARSLHPSLSPSHPGGSSAASLDDGGTAQVQIWQGAIPQVPPRVKTSSFGTNPQLDFRPPVDYQLTFDTFDGAYALLPQPSSSLLSTSSSAIECNGGERAAPLSSIHSVPFPMTAGPAPVHPPLTPMVPISGSPINASIPIVPMGTVPTAAAPTITSTFAHAEPRQVPTSRGLCPECVRPLVRVDNTIEWVRPDVMKMVVYFNFSSNAEAEAHSSWEHSGA